LLEDPEDREREPEDDERARQQLRAAAGPEGVDGDGEEPEEREQDREALGGRERIDAQRPPPGGDGAQPPRPDRPRVEEPRGDRALAGAPQEGAGAGEADAAARPARKRRLEEPRRGGRDEAHERRGKRHELQGDEEGEEDRRPLHAAGDEPVAEDRGAG